jgi:DNA-binding XRE family transcriptional regulator
MVTGFTEVKRRHLPSASELAIHKHPFHYLLRVEGPISKSFRRIMLLTALKKLHELFRDPGEATIHHKDSDLMSNYYSEFREISLREAHDLTTPEARSGFILKLRRHRAKLTLRQLAKRARLNSAHLCQIEKGKVKPHPTTLVSIEQALLECESA